MDMEKIKDDILLATLPDVVFDGWTDRALREGTVSAGYESSTALRAFPNGSADLVAHFSDWADRQMLAELERRGLESVKMRERIALAVRVRLEVLAPYQEAVRRALSFLTLPQNAALAARLLYRTVDTIWSAAGDTSTDFNFYTKRALLVAVLSSTVLYWLNDRSEEFRDTHAFLDRRIGDVMRLGRSVSGMQGMVGLVDLVPSPFRFARQIRRRATGT